jgi:hypothetical protein
MSICSSADDRRQRDRAVVGEPARADQAALFAREADEQHAAAWLVRVLREHLRDRHHAGRARTVVVGARPDHVTGLAEVVEVAAEHHVLVPQLRVAAGQHGEHVHRRRLGLGDRDLDPGFEGHVGAHRQVRQCFGGDVRGVEHEGEVLAAERHVERRTPSSRRGAIATTAASHATAAAQAALRNLAAGEQHGGALLPLQLADHAEPGHRRRRVVLAGGGHADDHHLAGEVELFEALHLDTAAPPALTFVVGRRCDRHQLRPQQHDAATHVRRHGGGALQPLHRHRVDHHPVAQELELRALGEHGGHLPRHGLEVAAVVAARL